MKITLLKSKIHRATVLQANLNYVGSITIDADLMQKAKIFEYEQVHVVDVDNGKRFVTYAIAGERGSGMICLNGAAARKVQLGDRVIIMSYALIDTECVDSFRPIVLFVDDKNRAIKVSNMEKHGEIF